VARPEHGGGQLPPATTLAPPMLQSYHHTHRVEEMDVDVRLGEVEWEGIFRSPIEISGQVMGGVYQGMGD
jgi:hypothetical protein